MKLFGGLSISMEWRGILLPGKRACLFIQRRMSIPLLLIALIALSSGASSQEKHATRRQLTPETTRLKITVPVGLLAGLSKDHYWIYLDGTMLSSPPYDTTSKWTVVPIPGGMEVYGRGGLTARTDEDGKLLRVNSALATANHFYRTLDVPLHPGTHTVDILVEGSGAPPVYESAFPFLLTGKKDVEVRQGRVTEYVPDVPSFWPLDVVAWPALAAWEGGGGRACPDNSAPDPEPIRRAGQSYLDMPVVKAMHGATPSYPSGSKRVVRLDLPEELGGSREFEDSQIQTIVNLLERIVYYKVPSSREILDCQRANPDFSAAYAYYLKVRDSIDNDIISLRKLAQ